jgi:hypothetical protein
VTTPLITDSQNTTPMPTPIQEEQTWIDIAIEYLLQFLGIVL